MIISLREYPVFTLLRKIANLVFIVSFILLIIVILYKPPLTAMEEIVPEIISSEPLQTDLPLKQPDGQQIVDIEGYEYHIHPLFNYEIKGLIVSEYDSDSWLDIRHADDPGNTKDLCLVWGENIRNGSYSEVKYRSGEFTCYYSWSKELSQPFIAKYLSNNHLIPANPQIAENIKLARIGDQVRIKGVLADYEVYKDAKKIYVRKSSTKRDDVRNGACEIIFVSEFEIVREHKVVNKYSKNANHGRNAAVNKYQRQQL